VTITTNTCGLPRILPYLFAQFSPGSSLVINAYYYAYKRGVIDSIQKCLIRMNGKIQTLTIAAYLPLYDTI
jgi:hypothetical protein